MAENYVWRIIKLLDAFLEGSIDSRGLAMAMAEFWRSQIASSYHTHRCEEEADLPEVRPAVYIIVTGEQNLCQVQW